MSSQSVWDALVAPSSSMQSRLTLLNAEKAKSEALLAQMAGDNVTADVLAARQACVAKIADVDKRITRISGVVSGQDAHLYANQSVAAQAAIDYCVTNLSRSTVGEIARSHVDVAAVHARTQASIASLADPAAVTPEALNTAYSFAVKLQLRS